MCHQGMQHSKTTWEATVIATSELRYMPDICCRSLYLQIILAHLDREREGQGVDIE